MRRIKFMGIITICTGQALKLAAIGEAANNRSDFDWAMATYDNGVDQIQPDGTLPLEMARGSRALHYHLYALAPAVGVAG